jgi:hypothetical protein
MSNACSARALLYVGLTSALLASQAAAQSDFVVSNNDNSIELEAGFSEPWIVFTDKNLGVLGGTRLIFTHASGPTLRFAITKINELLLDTFGGTMEVKIEAPNGSLLLAGSGQTQRYLADSDDDGPTGNHIWYQDSTAASDRMMQLQHTNGGDLLIAGQLSANFGFDVAETFWEQEPIEPGELVAVGTKRPDAVMPTSAPYQRTLLGVASSRPAITLGGGVFSVEALRQAWGEEIAEVFESQRSQLELQVFAERPDLAQEASRLRSTSSSPLDKQDLVAQEIHETLLFDATVQRFFDGAFSAVAMTGRVEVKADATFGAIRPGDYLTSSPVRGVAMKAQEPGPVLGVALEPLAAGAGTIMVYVDRGWFGGESRRLVDTPPAASAADPRDLEIVRLEGRLRVLETRLEDLVRESGAEVQAALEPAGRSVHRSLHPVTGAVYVERLLPGLPARLGQLASPPSCR